MKWTVTGYNKFEKKIDGYHLVVEGCYWFIYKNNRTIDCVFYHNGKPSGEIDAKVKAEKALQKVLNQPQ